MFSPSGADIAFQSDRKGNNDVYVLHLGTNSVEQLTTWASSETEPSYAPDGSALVYVSTISGATELWEQNLAGLAPVSKPIQITNDKQFKSHPSWGRDSRADPVRGLTPKATYPPLTRGACDLRLAPGVAGP